MLSPSLSLPRPVIPGPCRTQTPRFCHIQMTRQMKAWRRLWEIETGSVFSWRTLSIIYRLVSLRLGADSFIRWGESCFDLKIHTTIASGVEKVKEFPCVLIRKKLHDFFFFYPGRGKGLENTERGGVEDVLILIPASVIFLGNMGMFVWQMLFFFFRGSEAAIYQCLRQSMHRMLFFSAGMQNCCVYRWFGK